MSYLLRGTVSSKAQLWGEIASADALAFDMESLQVGVDEVVLGLGVGTDTFQAYVTEDRDIVELMEHFELVNGPRIAHAANADLGTLGATRDPRFFPIFDTMIAAHILGGHTLVNLKQLALEDLGLHIEGYSDFIKRFKAKDLSEIPLRDVATYNGHQIKATYLLWKKYSPMIEEDEYFPKVFDLEMQVLPILAEMENNGILINKKGLKRLAKQYTAEADALEEALGEITKGNILNVNSPKQVTGYIFGKGPGQLGHRPTGYSKTTGKPSANEKALTKLLEQNPRLTWVKLILQTRELRKLVGTYCDGIVEKLRYGRSHSHLSQVSTDTGRLASTDPNHQNIPKRTDKGLSIRRCFIAPKGYSLIACDMDQIELRILAEESNEPLMREAFLAGKDIHLQTAIDIFKDPALRFRAKVFNYTVAYLAGPAQIATQIHSDKKTAVGFQRTYFETYRGLTRWVKRVDRATRAPRLLSKDAALPIRTDLGRLRDLTEVYNHGGNNESSGFKLPALEEEEEFNVVEGTRKAVNTIIQGTAAEVMKRNLVELDKMLKCNKLQTRMLMAIHDEVLLEVPDDELEIAKEIVKEAMTTSYKNMPLPCTVKVGPNWADVH